MDTPIRFRLHYYPNIASNITTELILKHTGLGYEPVPLPPADPGPILRLTKGECYTAPVLEDVFNRTIAFNRAPAFDDIPRVLAELAPLMILYPPEFDGLNKIFETYVRNECEPIARKVCDVFRDKWTKNDIEAAMIRCQRERESGVGILDTWSKQLNDLSMDFNRSIQPFENILTNRPFLSGERPIYADYILAGAIGAFLFAGGTSLLNTLVMLEAWYTKMCAGSFKYREEAMKLDPNAVSDNSTFTEIQLDPSEIEKPVTDLKLRAAAQVLDVMSGAGHTAVFLAKKGFSVTAADAHHPNLVKTAELANSLSLGLTLKQHAPENLPYPNGSFNLVVVRARAHLMTDPELFVKECGRVLRTYGYLMIVDNIIPDDQVEADQWLNALEKLRDPGFVRYYTPNQWKKWCVKVGMTVTKTLVDAHKQPDLNWYLNTRNTSPENRKKIMEMIAKAPASCRELFKIGQEEGKITWQFRRMVMMAGKI